MTTKSINDVVIGSILEEPVKINGVLLVKEGTPISEQLKEVLPKFGVTEVTVKSIFNDKIDQSALDFSKLSKVTYIAMKRLDIGELIMCAKNLVQNSLMSENKGLLNVLLEYDEDTYRHSVNVANFAVTVGIYIGLTIEELHNVAIGALLHDIGKSELPTDIIQKNGKLTDTEYRLVKQHPRIGYLLANISGVNNSSVKQIIYQHHENYDGTGYPRNLYGKNSFRLARLIHICDVYEALCAKRSYKEALPRRAVKQIMEKGAGTQFDPKLLKQFFECIPLYLIGETVESDGRIGIICDMSDGINPMVYCNGDIYKLEDFEKLGSYSEDVVNAVT